MLLTLCIFVQAAHRLRIVLSPETLQREVLPNPLTSTTWKELTESSPAEHLHLG